MALILTAAPGTEPVTLAEAKAHLRVDGTAEDALISSLILTARLHVEAALGLALITQGWSYLLDAWPDGAVRLPIRPVESVSAVKVTAADGEVSVLAPERYVLDGAGSPPRLVPVDGPFPDPGAAALGIEIAFIAGYGESAADVPAPIRQALLQLIAHWFEHREPVDDAAVTRIPSSVSELLMPYREARL
ncbi:MAG TPA: head-tail connector protein [Hyphomicrobiaceae bacterium]|nr:head-tail connector protein [Hyphomicrobiaceae bacterium]